jgi:hypothetical protein
LPRQYAYFDLESAYTAKFGTARLLLPRSIRSQTRRIEIVQRVSNGAGKSLMQAERLMDEYAVHSVRRNWALARDNGDWDGFRACFHPDATVRVLWYSGPTGPFIEQTIESAAKRKPGGKSTRHWLGNYRVWLKGDRAILETDTMIINRDRFKGHLVDYVMNIRLYDRMERRDGEWRILRMDAIYDRDRLDPVIPGSLPSDFFVGVALEGPEAQMGITRWRLKMRGAPFPADLPIGGTDSETVVRKETEAWLNASPAQKV